MLAGRPLVAAGACWYGVLSLGGGLELPPFADSYVNVEVKRFSVETLICGKKTK